jgi:hypothetical protein
VSDNLEKKKGLLTMLQVSDTASREIKKVLDSAQAKGRQLVIYFQGFG